MKHPDYGPIPWMKHPDIHVVKEQVVGTASLLKNGTTTNNHSRRGAHAPLREEILSTPAPSSVIARRRQGDEVPSTGDARDRYGRLLRSLSLL